MPPQEQKWSIQTRQPVPITMFYILKKERVCTRYLWWIYDRIGNSLL